MLFTKKRYVVFVDKQYINSGLVVLKSEPLFYGNEGLPYTTETLSVVLAQVRSLSKGKKIRVVLGEELVYVTELSFPAGTIITRELVQSEAEASIPENVRETEWDFQTLRYAAKEKDEEAVSVQVAVVEHTFSQSLRRALEVVPLSIECILPESCVLAHLERATKGLFVIAKAHRETLILTAVENGSVAATFVKRGSDAQKSLEDFIRFIALRKGKKVDRIIFSHFFDAADGLVEVFTTQGYVCEKKDYNLLIGAMFEENLSGEDEDVLNIGVVMSTRKNFFRK